MHGDLDRFLSVALECWKSGRSNSKLSKGADAESIVVVVSPLIAFKWKTNSGVCVTTVYAAGDIDSEMEREICES